MLPPTEMGAASPTSPASPAPEAPTLDVLAPLLAQVGGRKRCAPLLTWAVYALSLVACGVVAVAVYYLRRWFRVQPAVLFFVVVVFCGWFGGFRVGAVAATVGSVTTAVATAARIGVPFLDDALIGQLGISLAGGGVASAAVAFFHRSQKAQVQANRQMLAVLDGMANGILAVNNRGELIYANWTAAQLFGLAAAGPMCVGDFDAAYTFTDASGAAVAPDALPYRCVFDGASVATATLAVRVPGVETPRWWQMRSRPVPGPDGATRFVVSIVEDVTREYEAEMAVVANERRLRLLMEASENVVYLCDAEGYMRDASPAVEHVFGYTQAEFLGQNMIAFIHPDDRESALRFLARCLAAPGETLTATMRVPHRDGSTLWVEGTMANRLDDPEIGAIVVNCHDITARKHMEDELREITRRDALTGLANRICFTERLTEAIERANAPDGVPFAVLFTDLDRFKHVNDGLGHVFGDRLLLVLAHRFTDALGDAPLVARLGGDEFAVLLEGPDATRAEVVTASLHEKLAAPVVLWEHEVYVSASTGITRSDVGYTRAEEVLRDADTAMYRAKAAGRGRIVAFNAGMHATAVATLQRENDLWRAVERGEFAIRYQPIMALDTLWPVGFETLARWRHPLHGWLAPDEFIALAEETGAVVPLDRWMLRVACEQVRRWEDAGLLPPEFAVSVNISGKQFAAPGFPDDILAVLREVGVSPHRLALEITERVLVEQTEATAMLWRLRDAGVRIYLDDFGVAYSSLAYVRQFPVSTLKLDRSFMGTVEAAERNGDIVEMVLTLARKLDIGMIVEGVETVAHLDQLRAMGCPYGQGFYFAPPLDAGAAEMVLVDAASLAVAS